jgi:diguanylate cyclase (GGDEF)-like protein
MGDLLSALQVTDVVAVPLQVRGEFLGVATAGWAAGEARTQPDGDVLDRLRGVGDQGATALEKARLLETVRQQALHDPLTGLPNRALFGQRLRAAVAEAGPDVPVAVLFCDLDRFKQVNDTYGHAAGDQLLTQVAQRLRAVVRTGDTVGRLSGDEFALVLRHVADPADTERLIERVTGCFAAPFRLDGRDVQVRASVGVAVQLASAGREHGEELLRQADAAMYLHKQRRRHEESSLV